MGRLSLGQADFVSSGYELTEKREFHLISAGLDTLSKSRNESEIENSLHAQLRGMIVPGISVLNYMDISQLFWKQQFFSVGRKKLAWSRLDEDFKLGIYQPLFKWNPLQYDSQGLTGIFMHLEPEETAIPWSVTVFGSPIFIPNQGAGYEIKDGKFEKNNPYFSTPPTTAEVNGQKTDFNYTVIRPELNEIVNQDSFAGRFEFGKSNEGVWLEGAYAQKPANELNLGFQGVLTSGQKIDTQILPKVMHHTVVSGELRYSFKYFTVGYEVMRDSPQLSEFEPQWTFATYSDADFSSAYVKFSMAGFEGSFSSLTRSGGDVDFIGPRSAEAKNVLISRYPFRDAHLLKLRYALSLRRYNTLALQSSYLRGTQGEFDLWNTTAIYQFQERWSGYLTSQLVSVKAVSENEKSIYHSYADNDLVVMGVSYVF